MKYVQRPQAKSPAIARLSGHTQGRATALESLLGTVKGKLRLSLFGMFRTRSVSSLGIFWILEYFQTFLH